MAIILEVDGAAPKILDCNQVVPSYTTKPRISRTRSLTKEAECSSIILKIIKNALDTLDLGKKKVDLYIDGEKCSEYNGMVFIEQFYSISLEDNTETELVQYWHSPVHPTACFSVVKKIIQIKNNISSFKIKEVGSRDFLLNCYKTPFFRTWNTRKPKAKRKRRSGF